VETQEQEIERTINEAGDRANGAAARALKQIFGDDARVELAIKTMMNTFGNLGFRGEIKLLAKNIYRQLREGR
jgi:hypothetical protein